MNSLVCGEVAGDAAEQAGVMVMDMIKKEVREKRHCRGRFSPSPSLDPSVPVCIEAGTCSDFDVTGKRLFPEYRAVAVRRLNPAHYFKDDSLPASLMPTSATQGFFESTRRDTQGSF